MKERLPFTNAEIQTDYIVATASGIIGGILGAVGAIIDSQVLVSKHYDGELVTWATGALIFGASLAVNGAVRFIDTRKTDRQQVNQQ